MTEAISPELTDLFITDELDRRPRGAIDRVLERRAVRDLVSRMAGAPEDVLPRFVDLAMELTGGVSAGLSLLEHEPSPGVFRWRHLQGALSPFEGATTPRNYSPCGVTLDADAPTLSLHPERYYAWISDAAITVPEVLLVPLRLKDGEAVGTLWIVSDVEGHFSRSHAEAVSELAWLVGVALQMVNTQTQLREALEEQLVLTKEMGHRVKNLIAVTDGMIRMGARSAQSVDAFAATLSGRLHALANAHSLVSRHLHEVGRAPRAADLETVVRVVLEPHAASLMDPRVVVSGPHVACGDRSINGLALVLHELATNASKYGALSAADGVIDVTWDLVDDKLVLDWAERGGPPVSKPEALGFGSRLLQSTISGQFGGNIVYEWRDTGLHAVMQLELTRVAD